MTDIIIPTYLAADAVESLVAEIKRTAGCPVNVIATCQKASASVNRNYGLEHSTSDPLLMVDDDVYGFSQGWAAHMIRVMEEYPDCVMLTAELMRPDGKPGFCMGDPIRGGTGVSVVPARKLPTPCVAVRKDELRYDEHLLGSGFDDNDICEQLRRKYPNGIWLICHDVRVIHKNEMKNQRGPYWDRNRAYMILKYGTVP